MALRGYTLRWDNYNMRIPPDGYVLFLENFFAKQHL